MLTKVFAGWLVVVAVLPFTQPFSAFTVKEMFGSRPCKRWWSDTVTCVCGTKGGVADLESLPARAVARSVVSPRRNRRLAPSARPQTGLIVFAGPYHMRSIAPNPLEGSRSVAPRAILRL